MRWIFDYTVSQRKLCYTASQEVIVSVTGPYLDIIHCLREFDTFRSYLIVRQLDEAGQI